MNINQEFLNTLKSSSNQRLDVTSFDQGQSSLRRGASAHWSPKTARVQLVMDGDGVLDWEDAAPMIPGIASRRRGRAGAENEGAKLVEFSRLEPSKVTEFLAKQDKWLTPANGIRAYDHTNKSLVGDVAIPTTGRILLFIHGTFSNSDNVFKSLQATPHGDKFLESCSQRYGGNIFSFDHPTMSVGPLLNAIDLNRVLGKSKAQIDIISHSRGGLVTRWWCEAFDADGARCRNAILVGAPLAGTGLAAPPNIRKTLKLLTNYGHALKLASDTASLAVPVIAVASTLLQVITAFTSLGAKTPLADMAMALIPGLFGQSRVGNNPELLRLHQLNGNMDRYAAVQSDFATEAVGWKFWKYFNGERILDYATDVLFDGPNDMVVDTASMRYLSKESIIPKSRTLDFGKSDRVHHVNYFDFPETIEHFRTVLGL